MGVWQELHGERVLFPILRPANSDLNLTIAMSLASVFASHLSESSPSVLDPCEQVHSIRNDLEGGQNF